MVKLHQVSDELTSQRSDQPTVEQLPTGDRSLILIVDDEPAIGESLAYSFKDAGFDSLSALTLGEANRLLHVHQNKISLVILDLTLPDGHGFDWLKTLRGRSSLPVIILSSHDDEIEHIVGLEIGADDFIDKPFSPREVVARTRAILRRVHRSNPLIPSSSTMEMKTTEASANSHSQQIIIDYSQYKVLVNGVSLGLSQLEFSLFETLHLERRVHTRAQLLHKAWRGGVSVSERTVDVHITALRKKWSEHRQEELIETIRGVGYRFAENLADITILGQPLT